MDSALEDVCAREIVMGPDVVALFQQLEARPKVTAEEKGFAAKLAAAREAANSAKEDVAAAASLSVAMRTAAAKIEEDTTKTLAALEAKVWPQKTLTAAELDVKRAEAFESKVGFEERSAKRVATMQEDVIVMVQEIHSARKALQEQGAALELAASQYRMFWEEHDSKVVAGLQQKVDSCKGQLTEALADAPPSPAPVEDQTAEMERIRPQMVALSTRLEEQAAVRALQMRTVIAEAAETMAGWKRHCEGVTAETELVKSALPAAAVPLSQEETAERVALVADSHAPSILAKGSGKGVGSSATDGVNY